MFWRLLLAFSLIPIAEIALFVEVGRRIGTLPTIGLILGTGLLGAFLARSQGFSVLRQIRTDLNDGRLPADGLIDGVFVLIGAAFLVTPGLLTDSAGFALMLPVTRRMLRRWVKIRIENWLEHGTVRIYMR